MLGAFVDKRAIAIIPARGGSKRIPGKNIRSFCGKPVIAYSIEAAIESGCFAEVMVSTDDLEIAQLSVSYGAKVPFLRTADTSGDQATTAQVLMEVLDCYKREGEAFDYCCCIYPTAPFVTYEKLREAFGMLVDRKVEAVITAVEYSYPIQRALEIRDGLLMMAEPELMNVRTQDLTPSYHDAGQFYWLDVNSFLLQKKVFLDNACAFVLSEKEVQDIDNEEDWEIAELKYKIMSGK